MKAHLLLDPIACDGHGLCAELLPERVTLDARYAAEWSLGLDARILLRTVWVVVSGDGSS